VRPEQSDAAAIAAKLALIWSAVVSGFTSVPWSHVAAALASLYSIHLIVGWWIDRVFGPRATRRRSTDKRGWWRR